MTQQMCRRCLTFHVLKHIMDTVATVSLTQALAAEGNCFWPGRWSSSHKDKKKFNGVKSGDLGGHTIDGSLLNHPPDIMWLRWFLTSSARSKAMIFTVETLLKDIVAAVTHNMPQNPRAEVVYLDFCHAVRSAHNTQVGSGQKTSWVFLCIGANQNICIMNTVWGIYVICFVYLHVSSGTCMLGAL